MRLNKKILSLVLTGAIVLGGVGLSTETANAAESNKTTIEKPEARILSFTANPDINANFFDVTATNVVGICTASTKLTRPNGQVYTSSDRLSNPVGGISKGRVYMRATPGKGSTLVVTVKDATGSKTRTYRF